MGTNFYRGSYRRGVHDSMDPEYHIGKRYAAGLYCWGCKVIDPSIRNNNFTCPKCGKVYDPKSEGLGSVGVELGFNGPATADERTGIKGVSGFHWSVDPKKINRLKKIVDEYGRVYTLKQFKELVLDNCPIQSTDSVGKWFS